VNCSWPGRQTETPVIPVSKHRGITGGRIDIIIIFWWEIFFKNTKKFEVEKLVRVIPRGKTVVQQYGVKTMNGNINALK